MNEREAIEFEMKELKEQGRLDFEMYFELRKYRSSRYNELQNRLREIDERDLKLKEVKQDPPAPKRFARVIPRSNHLTHQDLKIDRVEKLPDSGKSLVPYEVLTKAIEDYLKESGSSRTKDIKIIIQNKFGKEWTNFGNVMDRVIKLSPYIHVNKSKKQFEYYYKEPLIVE